MSVSKRSLKILEITTSYYANPHAENPNLFLSKLRQLNGGQLQSREFWSKLNTEVKRGGFKSY